LAQAGARVTLVSGPTALVSPVGVTRVSVESAEQMLNACEAALPADIFVGAAAVADWTPEKPLATKLKKRSDTSPPSLVLRETMDILAHISHHPHRPKCVIGFAAETESDPHQLETMAEAKRIRKGCDWLIANDVSDGAVFGQRDTNVILTGLPQTAHFSGSKRAFAAWLVERIIDTNSSSIDDVTPASRRKNAASADVFDTDSKENRYENERISPLKKAHKP
jgi:phosphopantothenoylcysteine decarboxylase/phosphopantothenate--cysteine ligase